MSLTRPHLAAFVPAHAIALFMLAACSTNTSQTTSSADHALSTSSSSETTVMASSTTETTAMASSTTETTVPASSTDDGAVTAVIKSFKFVPDPITISVGDAITWTNEDPVGHTVTARDDSFKTGMFFPGDSATVTFATAGTFPYFCSTHPEMVGTVVVETTG